MCQILYLQTDPKDAQGVSSSLLAGRKYDALFCDRVGERENLNLCLESLKEGDVLYIAREAELSDEFSQAVKILASLARRGVSVWVERLKRLFTSANSPFRTQIGEEDAAALIRFHKAFISERLELGRANSQKKAGRPRKPLPEGFEEARKDWLEGKTTSVEAATRCGMPLATFRKWAKTLA